MKLRTKCQAGELHNPETLYETSLVGVSIWIKSALSMAGFGLNIERPTSNVEYWRRYALSIIRKSESQNVDSSGGQVSKSGFSMLSFFKLTECIIRCWTFDVRCSMFDVHFLINPSCGSTLPKFHYRSNWPLFRPYKAALNTETSFIWQHAVRRGPSRA